MGSKMFLNNWQGGSSADVFRDFDVDYCNGDFKDCVILLASYGSTSDEGSDCCAFVLFRRDGKLWEVNGSHCSCYGLEGQWDPEETTVDALRHRVMSGTLGKGDSGENLFADELLQVLDSLW